MMWIIGFLLKLQKRHYLSDSALEMLLKFLSMLFVVIGKFSSFAAGISAIFPSSLYKVRKITPSQGQFTEFVVCSKCNCLYFHHDSFFKRGSHLQSKMCNYNQFPHNERAQCRQLLMKTVKCQSEKYSCIPLKCIVTVI